MTSVDDSTPAVVNDPASLVPNGVFLIHSVAHPKSVLEAPRRLDQIVVCPKNSPDTVNQKWKLEVEHDETSDKMRVTLENQLTHKYLVPEKDENDSDLTGSLGKNRSHWTVVLVDKTGVGQKERIKIMLVREGTDLALTVDSQQSKALIKVQELKPGSTEQLFELERERVAKVKPLKVVVPEEEKKGKEGKKEGKEAKPGKQKKK